MKKYFAETVSKLQSTEIISGKCYVMRVADGAIVVIGPLGENHLFSALFTLLPITHHHRLVITYKLKTRDKVLFRVCLPLVIQLQPTHLNKATHQLQGVNQGDIPRNNHPNMEVIHHNQVDIHPNPVGIPNRVTLISRATVCNFSFNLIFNLF